MPPQNTLLGLLSRGKYKTSEDFPTIPEMAPHAIDKLIALNNFLNPPLPSNVQAPGLGILEWAAVPPIGKAAKLKKVSDAYKSYKGNLTIPLLKKHGVDVSEPMLFHNTKFDALKEILKDKHLYSYYGEPVGVSFSRNPQFGLWETGPVQMVFDRGRLLQTRPEVGILPEKASKAFPGGGRTKLSQYLYRSVDPQNPYAYLKEAEEALNVLPKGRSIHSDYNYLTFREFEDAPGMLEKINFQRAPLFTTTGKPALKALNLRDIPKGDSYDAEVLIEALESLFKNPQYKNVKLVTPSKNAEELGQVFNQALRNEYSDDVLMSLWDLYLDTSPIP